MSPGVLLDTHALLWWFSGDRGLTRKARSRIESADTVYVSAACAWEICTKARLGKLPEAHLLVENMMEYVASQDFATLSITFAHGQRAGRLPGPHRDPFDRMLIAQAQAENLPVISADVAFDFYGVERVW